MLDCVDDFEKRALCPDEKETASVLDTALLDVLVENHVVELLGVLISHFVRQLTTLGLDHISAAGAYTVDLRVLTPLQVTCHLLLVGGDRVFMINQSSGR